MWMVSHGLLGGSRILTGLADFLSVYGFRHPFTEISRAKPGQIMSREGVGLDGQHLSSGRERR
jgi:hypothetical protein